MAMVQAALLVAAMNTTLSFPEATSFNVTRMQDSKAVYLEDFSPKRDGVADDTSAIQRAIDKVEETTGEGVLFVPSGRYRLTKTINVWPGIRVIGVGPTRPIFLLAESTPGFQKVEKFMVFFGGDRPRTPEPESDRTEAENGLDFWVNNEANPGTFYSAMSNIDIEIKPGNQAAVGIRGRYAQHCHLSHMDFRLESGLAAVHDTGNFAEDLRFFGGEYGLITRTPSPGWQFTMMDSHFEGQSKAAIRTHETGLTLIGNSFKDVPTAISIEPNRSEQLWMENCVMENISGPAILISKEDSHRLQINVQNLACQKVALLAKFRESGREVPGKRGAYMVKDFTHGAVFADQGSDPQIKTIADLAVIPGFSSISAKSSPQLPKQESWVNVQSFGAKGDGESDDTEAIKKAIAQHRAIYFPCGKYLVTDTIVLKPETALIGLNPITTQILIKDGTLGFRGMGQGREAAFAGEAKPLLFAPAGGTCIVSGLGLDSGGNNPAACAAKWLAGKDSMIEDVKFLGGHGSGVPWNQIYNANHSADGKPGRPWDSQYPSLWVTEGGGGVFKNIWTASPYAQAGMMISDTKTPGRVYQMSSEHHVRHEVQMRNVSNWEIVSLQCEEERGEGPFALPLEITNCRDITLANLNIYRVISVFQPFPYAVKVQGSENVRFRGAHCYSNSKASFDSLILDDSSGAEVRQREFAFLNLTKAPSKPKPSRVVKLAHGFFNISGGVAGPKGDFYFVDSRWQRIYRWRDESGVASIIQDSPLQPVNMAIDKSGNLLVVSYAGSGVVYSFHPDSPNKITVLTAEPAKERPSATAWLPVTDWNLSDEVLSGRPSERPFHYVSPDGSAYISATQDFVEGATSWGVKSSDLIRSFGLAPTAPGKPFYLSGEAAVHSYSVVPGPDGSLARGRLFAEQGGEGVAIAADGKVYLAAGQIYVYSPEGALLETIRVPERPIQIVFGGKDGKTLFIAARTSLYSLKVK